MCDAPLIVFSSNLGESVRAIILFCIHLLKQLTEELE